MRIIGGSAGGIILKVPKGLEVRPTPDLVRQAIFNSLGARVAAASVLELFAGTGALALECLSRGATHALCVEKSARHAKYIEENAQRARIPTTRLDIRVQDAFTAIGQLAGAQHEFDLIVADPPYGEKNVGSRSQSFAQRLLDDSSLPRLLKPSGMFILGHTKRDTLDVTAWWQETRLLKHGDTVIRFFERAP